MSQKILAKTESVLEQMDTSDDVAEFVQNIIAFECFEKKQKKKKRYNEELEKATSKGEGK